MRPHKALGYKTLAEIAGIQVRGKDKWLTIIQNAVKEQVRCYYERPLRHDIVQIVEQARALLNTSGYPSVQIISVTPNTRRNLWTVNADVGIIDKNIREIVIDDRTGKVIEFH
jgi:hypothetical protein